MGARDYVTGVPTYCDQEEATVLIQQLTCYQFTSMAFEVSLRGETNLTKMVAMRCIWFGWLSGRDWKSVGTITQLGKKILETYLIDCEKLGHTKETEIRKEWFPTEAERSAASLAAKNKAERYMERSQIRRNKSIETAQRITSIQSEIGNLSFSIGRGQVNDIDGALDTLRGLTKEYDACRVTQQQIEEEDKQDIAPK